MISEIIITTLQRLGPYPKEGPLFKRGSKRGSKIGSRHMVNYEHTKGGKRMPNTNAFITNAFIIGSKSLGEINYVSILYYSP